MAYGTPTDPVAGTVITVAYFVANGLDPIRALRAFTGGADPPGSGYVVTSNSTSATSWKTGITAIAAVLGYTPVNKVGDSMSGALALANNVAYQLRESSTFARDVLKMTALNLIEFGNVNNTLQLLGAKFLIDNDTYLSLKEASGFVRDVLKMNDDDEIELGNANNTLKLLGPVEANGNSVLTTADEGSGNGIDADTVDGSHASAFAVSSHNHNSSYAVAARGVPDGFGGFFATLAELTAAGAEWERYSAADGRLLVGAGASASSQTFTEATNYGTGWVPVSGLTASASAISATAFSAGAQGPGAATLATNNHTHPAPTVAISGQGAVYLPYSRAVIWARKTS